VPADWADGTEVILRPVHGPGGDEDPDRPPTPDEIAHVLAAMEKVEPFDMTDADRAEADRWEKAVNDYTRATLDRGIEDVFR